MSLSRKKGGEGDLIRAFLGLFQEKGEGRGREIVLSYLGGQLGN